MNEFYMIENHPADSRVRIDESGTCQTLSARCGTGGGIPQWSYSYVPNRYAEYNLGLPTLRASGGDIGGGSEALVCVKEGFDMECYPKITGALCANSHPGSYTGQDAFNNMLPVIRRENDVLDMPENRRIYEGGCSSTLAHRDYKDARDLIQEDNMEQDERKYVLRRLTPTECLRLMGLPDWWCDGADGRDSAIYKMCGNGIGIPCAYDVLGRIVKAYEREGEAK